MKTNKSVAQLHLVTFKPNSSNLSRRLKSVKLSTSSHTCSLSSKQSTTECLLGTYKLIVGRQLEASSQVRISLWPFSTCSRLKYLIRHMDLQHRSSRSIPMQWTRLKLILVSIRGRDRCWQTWSVHKNKPWRGKGKNASKLGDRWRHRSLCWTRPNAG